MNIGAPAVREILAPEGITLPFEVGSRVDRVIAFIADTLIIHGAVLVLSLLCLLAAGHGFGAYALSFILLSSFILRNFYFIYLESRWGGVTIGKRMQGLRVISRDGGPLTTEAVLARNLTRDLEVFLPLTALAAPNALLPGVPVWAALLGSGWLLVFAVLPLVSRDVLRVGDLVGGTLVVRMPKATLLPDLAAAGTAGKEAEAPAPAGILFTREQLDLYGIRELQILEDLLRKDPSQARRQLLEAVARKVKKKIRWPRERWNVDTVEFLTAFYRAQRGRLEEKMLFGIRQERKIR